VSCGLIPGGHAFCWGDRTFGQIGDGATYPLKQTTPALAAGGLTFVQISVGDRHVCGLTSNGQAYCWGADGSGQLGDSSMLVSMQASPVAVRSALTFKQLAAGAFHTCGLTTDGAAYCWGDNSHGQLGFGSPQPGLSGAWSFPVAVVGGLTFAQLAAGDSHTCGLTTSGLAYCWGQNNYGQLGDDSTTDEFQPIAVSGGLTLRQLALGDFHSCGMASDGNAYCWGWNAFGQLGDGTTNTSTTPRRVTSS
jgi:alpha-tubulin suppressor-like RCC1 family protein